MNLIKIKALLAKSFHIQPSEIDNMYMWEYELFMQHLNDAVKEDNEAQQKEADKYNLNDYKKLSRPDSIQKMTQPKMPTMPSMSFK